MPLLGDWRPETTIKQILRDIQEFLCAPNADSMAQFHAHNLYTRDRSEYDRRVRTQAEAMTATE